MPGLRAPRDREGVSGEFEEQHKVFLALFLLCHSQRYFDVIFRHTEVSETAPGLAVSGQLSV